MPRVLRIINRLNLGGPTYNAALLTRYMAPEFETLLVAGSKQDSEASSEFILEDLGISATNIQTMHRELNLLNDFASYQKIKKIIHDFKPDIVHTHAAKAGALGRLAAFHMHVPVTVHTFHGHIFHSYFNPLKTNFFLGIERYLAKKSSAVIAISEGQKEELSMHYKICPMEKVHIIPLGFNLMKFRDFQETKRKGFRDNYLLKDDEIAIGIIGRLVPVKNHGLFLNALRKVFDQSNKKVRAFIIGDGEEREKIKQAAHALRIDAVDFSTDSRPAPLIFTSWIKNIDTAFAGLDIIAMSSLNEGTPVSLIEAQAAGKPIVATYVGGIRNVVIPDQTALLSASGNAEDFAANLTRLVEDERLRKKMSESGWEHVRTKFHYTRLVQDMSNLYRELLN